MGAAQSEFGMEAALRGLAQRGYRPAVVYDVGAAEGGWTRMAAAIWPQASFICFEPLQERDEALARLATDFPGRVQSLRIGVGDADVELAMGVEPGLWSSSFAYGASASRTLPVRRLDRLVAEGAIPAASFLKIDVQGFERRVIEGAGKALDKVEFILMECQFFAFCADMRTLDDTIAFMSQRGFAPYEFVDFLRRPLDGAMGQCDLIFARKGHQVVADARWG